MENEERENIDLDLKPINFFFDDEDVGWGAIDFPATINEVRMVSPVQMTKEAKGGMEQSETGGCACQGATTPQQPLHNTVIVHCC